MNCKAARRVLSSYLDHELSRRKISALEAHLAGCPECQAQLAAHSRLWDLLGQAAPVQSPNLLPTIEARLSERRSWVSIFSGLRFRTIGYAAATAILVALFIWTGIWAGAERQRVEPITHDRAFVELMSDLPPGMEVVALLDTIGKRP